MKCPCCRQEVPAITDLFVSIETNTMVFRGQSVQLPPRQIEILSVLAEHAPNMVTRERIIMRVWSQHEPNNASKSLDVHIHKMRKVLLPMGLKITTHWARGYSLQDWITPVRTAAA